VENSIQHGLKAFQSEGKLKLEFEVNNSFLKVTINDNRMGYFKSLESTNRSVFKQLKGD
jgi:LytS/YehU family sensor histidine kinase